VTERIGFIGLGAMGRPMATRLLQAGHRVSVYARRPEAAAPLAALGASVCESPAALARVSEVVFTIVTATHDVEQVLLGADGVAAGAAAGTLVVDMSTISPIAVRRMAGGLAARGISLLDAPVSGGAVGAEAGTLAVMVGGDARAFERARPLLGVFGRTVMRIGESGSGQIAKACSQLALCVAMQGAAEALALARRLGADPGKVREIMLAGYASSKALEVFGERMVRRDFAAGVESRLHHKDLQIVLNLAHELGLPVPAAAVTTQTFNALAGAGGSREDSVAILRIIEGPAGA